MTPTSRVQSATRPTTVFRHVALLLLSAVASTLGGPLPRVEFGAMHEPVGQVLHGVGHGEPPAANYVQTVGPRRHPVFFTFYTGAHRTVAQHTNTLNLLSEMLSIYPHGMGIQLGLFMVDREEEINAGLHDAGLAALADGLDALNRPIFVRIGCEANGSWNRYTDTPSQYIAAFRRIAGIFHDRSDRIATVWCVIPINGAKIPSVYPGTGTYANPDPNDPWIDWWSVDLFEQKYIDPAFASDFAITHQFLERAGQARKPVLIGESTPLGIGTEGGETIWNDWFAHYFQLIHDYPVIKAFTYINWDWTIRLGTGWESWGDCRIEVGSDVAERMRLELDRPLYAHLNADGHVPVHVLRAEADAFAGDGGNADTAFGTTSPDVLEIRSSEAPGGQRRTFLRFDLSRFSGMEHASLQLFGGNASTGDVDSTVQSVSNDWDEATLTWNNQPALGDSLGSLDGDPDTGPEWESLDITAYVRAQIAAGATQISLCLANATVADVTVHYATKDADAGPPQLVVRGKAPSPGAPAPLLPPLLEPGGPPGERTLTLRIPTDNGQSYQIWESPDLLNWSRHGAAVQGDGSIRQMTFEPIGNRQFFLGTRL